MNKTLLLLLLILCTTGSVAFSQVIKNYSAEWKKVDELIQKQNLPKTALVEVKKIYALAKKEKQDAQIIKSLVYMISLQQENREGNQILSIKEIEKEIAANNEPAVSILKSLLGDLYWQYFQQYRWRLYDRTNTVNFNKDDIATWTIEDFHKKISSLYLESIQNETLLKNTRLDPFNAIIIKGNVRHLRPTLFDLLAHKALSYFKNDERDIKKPSYAFDINQLEAFAPAEQFAAYKFLTRDTLSLKHKALLLYQKLIAFHLNDPGPDALIDVDIDRLQFVYQNSVVENKDEYYRQALSIITKKYTIAREASQAWYLLASYYENLANRYQPLNDTSHRYARIQAKEILEKIVRDSANYKGTEGWANSYNLLNEITKPQFSFELEKVNVPGQPFRSLIKYRNLPALNFRLIKADENLKQLLQNSYDEKYWTALLKAPPVKNWQQTLPATNDLQQHSVETKIDALPVGEYILLASGDKSFERKNALLGARLFYISSISYVNQGNKVFVLHRESGQPLEKAAINLWLQEYDYKTSRYTKAKRASYTTDKNGYFIIERKTGERERGYYLDIQHKEDHLFLEDIVYNYYYSDQRDQKIAKRIFFFTDRSIYRPGQTVHFKGIVISKDGKENSIVTGFKTKVFLANANNEVADSIELTTNEFGSFSGKFQLPQNILNGSFNIYTQREQDYANMVEFSVEEYKRPKFYVEFDKVKESYKVGDSITVIGNAKAYAGNNINGAQVMYRIIRQARFPYPWLYRGWWPRVEPMEIAHGEAVTDANGKFSIRFKAIPDLSVDKKTDPVFDYSVHADVTDINGETRSNEQRISAGYKSLLLNVKLTERIPLDSLKNIFIRTENMSGEYQPSTITVAFTKLIPENRLIRKRYWQQPDQFVLNKEEFIKNFPHDEYRSESDYKTWEKGERVFSKTDSTRMNSQFVIDNSQLQTGFYEITITTKDKDGNEVKDIRYVELYDQKTNTFSGPEYIWAKGSRPIEPGEKTTIDLGSAASSVFVVQQITKDLDGDRSSNKNGEEELSFLTLNNQKKSLNYSATEQDRGGYGVSFFFIKDNRFYQFNDIISVPWSNKELNIEYATFRDKTLPGSEEKWKVKISGYKGEKLAAEMLASMYDASLDEFKPHGWTKPEIWPTFAHQLNWNGSQNFSSIESQPWWQNNNDYKSFDKRYDFLNFGIGSMRDARRMRMPSPKDEMEEAMSMNKDEEGLSGNLSGITVTQAAAPPTVDGMDKVTVGYGSQKRESMDLSKPQILQQKNQNIQPRKNFNETAFFFPDLKTDQDGNIEFAFTIPEALTKWKLQTIAHTKGLALGLSTKEIVTQKELMVQPNTPRFLREGDKIELSTKVVNLSDKPLNGQAELQLFDAATNKPLNNEFKNISFTKSFSIATGQSNAVSFAIEIPSSFTSALIWRIVAKAGNYSDGEEALLPVLTNRMLVTETMPLPMRGSGTKNFSFDKLLQSVNSKTIVNHALTVEYTSNPAWYAVQALPYLMDYPYECAEQTWNRYYANALASRIVNSSPRIKQVFEKWKTSDTAALLSNLQKNQELKSVLLEETPWVLQAKSETQQKKNIALLFDLVRMSNELKKNFELLKTMQSENGGFVWFKGGPDDRYITQYIVTGIGHLRNLGGLSKQQEEDLTSILRTAIPYLDKKIKEDYDNLIKHKADLKKQNIGYLEIQYLYMRSFFPQYKIAAASQTAYTYFRKQSQQFWTKQNNYAKGMTALALNRTGDVQTPAAILKSLKEIAIINEELGMYWKDNSFGRSWFWWYAPIETQSLLIEAFSEITKDTKTVDDLRTWLIKNKQTNNWHTTKATAEACYAMLLQGTDWLSTEPTITIQLGNTTISNTEQKTEAGTGYFKKTIDVSSVNPAMGNISVSVQQPINQSTNKPINSPSWGAVYWQYFEDLDKITTAATPLQLNKKLFVEKNSDRGPVLTSVADNNKLKVGDKIKVRIELRVDRDMEYVHMKDMRASALEPVNVLSGYKWQGGLGYYESTKDASTNFFFNYLPKGTYVFEYPLFVTHAGNFSNGITSIQCMYAPEFSAHSEGVRVQVQ
jgi:hypothetical protein